MKTYAIVFPHGATFSPDIERSAYLLSRGGMTIGHFRRPQKIGAKLLAEIVWYDMSEARETARYWGERQSKSLKNFVLPLYDDVGIVGFQIVNYGQYREVFEIVEFTGRDKIKSMMLEIDNLLNNLQYAK